MSREYCCGCNGQVPGIRFNLGNSSDGKVYVERCLDCCRFGSHRTAANHVSSETWWRVYNDGNHPYFLVTLDEARAFVRRNQVTLEAPEQDSDECEDCEGDESGRCREHCSYCQNGDPCSYHEEEDA